jgi:formylglycine-generating enzyme required for sulfatase activity
VAIALFVFIWLCLQGQASWGNRFSPPSAAAIGAHDATRFNADAWYLPADELLGFVEIPAGQFTMGSDPAVDKLAYENERWSAAQLQGMVVLPTFHVARYETTVSQYAAFVNATGHRWREEDLAGAADHPVVNVSWADAVAYAQWLDAQMRTSTHTPVRLATLLREGWRVSLPSEAEWEKAARGVDGRIYPWGNDAAPGHANFLGRGTAAVGSYPCASCAYQLADMSGNVWELTRSPLQPYPYGGPGRAAGRGADALYVMRGGSFNERENNIRAAVRGGIDPGVRRSFIGFRVVITPP